MKSYDVIRQAVDEPGVKAVAAALRVSPALVYKWCEPPADVEDPDQSGAKNPLDRVREMYLLTKDIRLIRWLCNEAGGFYVANPVPELRRTLDETIFGETRGMVRDFSELLDAVTEAVGVEHHAIGNGDAARAEPGLGLGFGDDHGTRVNTRRAVPPRSASRVSGARSSSATCPSA